MVTTGAGIVQSQKPSFDDRGDHSEEKKYRPNFIYTMPARLLKTDSEQRLSCCDSLESLFLSLIWIATTRSGPRNQKRAESSRYKFRYTELYKWNKHDYSEDCFPRAKMGKMLVMRRKSSFKHRVLEFIHPYFAELKPCLRALRALLYDAQWEESRNELAKRYPTEYARLVFVKVFNEGLEGLWTLKQTVAERAEVFPPLSNRNTVLGVPDQCSSTVHVKHNKALEETCLDMNQNAPFRFIRGRRTSTFLADSAALAVSCEATDDISRTVGRLPNPDHTLFEDADEGVNKLTGLLRTHGVIQVLHAAGFAKCFEFLESPMACLW